MRFKTLIAVFMVAALPLGFAGMSFSAQAINGMDGDGTTLLAWGEQQKEEVRGTVSKIEGTEITVMTTKGEEKTITVSDPETLKDFKVGDRVLIKDGEVIKE